MSSFDKGFLRPKKDGRSGGIIKSIQKGTTTILDTTYYTNVTISNVDMANSIIIASNVSSSGDASNDAVSAKINNSTQIELRRENSSTVNTIEWQVIEFYPGVVKSIQRGASSISGVASINVTVSAIKISKTILYHTFSISTASTTSPVYMSLSGKVLDSTTLTFAQASSTYNTTVYWQLVEFY